MTLEQLQNEMIQAMKTGDKFRKSVISTVIAQIKNAAIDKGCRDNIAEDMVNAELLRAKKITQEMITTCPESRQDLLENYNKQMKIICELAPSLITDTNEIEEIIRNSGVEMNKGKIMKYLSANFKGKIDMSVANKVVGGMLR